MPMGLAIPIWTWGLPCKWDLNLSSIAEFRGPWPGRTTKPILHLNSFETSREVVARPVRPCQHLPSSDKLTADPRPERPPHIRQPLQRFKSESRDYCILARKLGPLRSEYFQFCALLPYNESLHAETGLNSW